MLVDLGAVDRPERSPHLLRPDIECADGRIEVLPVGDRDDASRRQACRQGVGRAAAVHAGRSTLDTLLRGRAGILRDRSVVVAPALEDLQEVARESSRSLDRRLPALPGDRDRLVGQVLGLVHGDLQALERAATAHGHLRVGRRERRVGALTPGETVGARRGTHDGRGHQHDRHRREHPVARDAKPTHTDT